MPTLKSGVFGAKVYSRALTPDEVAAEYEQVRRTFYPTRFERFRARVVAAFEWVGVTVAYAFRRPVCACCNSIAPSWGWAFRKGWRSCTGSSGEPALLCRSCQWEGGDG